MSISMPDRHLTPVSRDAATPHGNCCLICFPEYLSLSYGYINNIIKNGAL